MLHALSVKILGSASAFHKVYEEPIIASRQPTATATEKVMGEARANQVITSSTAYICTVKRQKFVSFTPCRNIVINYLAN